MVAEEFLAVTKDVETPLSDWELVRSYFGKYHVLLAVLSLLLVLVHIWFAPPKLRAILVRWGFDLPDTMAQFIFSAVVVLQVENVVKMIHQFIRARYWQCESILLHIAFDMHTFDISVQDYSVQFFPVQLLNPPLCFVLSSK